MDIRGALSKLDPTNDDQWTNDGLPRVDALQAMGLKDVTRGQITAASPNFTRFNRNLEDQEDLPEGQFSPEVVEPTAGMPDVEAPREVSLFGMESSEFAGAAPEETPPPPAPVVDVDAAKAALEAADEAVRKAQEAERSAKQAAAEAQRLRDAAVINLERSRTPQESQQVLMNYLNSVKPQQGKTAEMAPIDRAHQRPMGYGKARPQYPTKR